MLALPALMGQTMRPTASCGSKLETLVQTVDAFSDAGGRRWASLLPLVAETHRCYRQMASPPAELFRYETYVLVQSGHYAEAEASMTAFFAGPANAAPPDLLARMYWRRGYVRNRLGQIAGSLEAYTQAAELADRLPPLEAANVLLETGERFRLLPDRLVAERYIAEAERRLPASADEPARNRAWGWAQRLRAELLLDAAESGDVPPRAAASRALPHAREAARLLRASREPLQRFRYTHALLAVSTALRLSGHPAQASVPIAEARRHAEALRETYPLLLSRVWMEEAHVALALGRHREARDAYEQELATCELAADLECQAEAHLHLGRLDESEQQFEAAGRSYRTAIRLNEEHRAGMGVQAWSAAAFVDQQKPYRALVRILLERGRAREAFVELDQTRARYLRDLRALGRTQHALSLDAQARIDSLTDVLRATRRALAAPDLSIARRSTLERDALALQGAIERDSQFHLRPPPSLDLAALQRTLGARGQVLLSYFLEGASAYAFVVRADTLVAIRLAASPDAIRTGLADAGGLWRTDDAGTDVDLPALHRLYTLLFAPVRAFVPDGRRLVVIPEDALTRLPFGILVEQPHPRFRYADAPYLIRRHPVSTELSAALLLAPPSDRTTGEVLILGRTRFSGLPALPRVADEVERIGVELPGAHLALNQTATEAALEQRLGRVRLLHIASHAFANPALPLYSSIRLWDDPDAPDDGTLHLHELVGRRLDADLVVLSGCGTARGSALAGEGMLGLQHAFRASGVRSTVATLWNAEDRATGELMVRFYAALRRGRSKDVALQEAQLGYLAAHDGRAANPFFWAGPVLYGDTSPMPHLVPARPSTPVWYALGLVLVAAALALPRLRRAA